MQPVVQTTKPDMPRISNLERKYVSEVLDNSFETSKNSIFNNRLEALFAEKYHSRFAIGHVNGTATLHTALAASGVREGDEVIVPPLTMSSTALSVLQNKSVPVFADVDKRTFNIDPSDIRKRVTSRTRAIMTVALYGLSPEYDEIQKICQEHDLRLIEDNAETFFSVYKGKFVGEFGDFASFSFQASKHLTTGEGGMLICNDEQLADQARKFSSLGYAGVDAKKGKITKDDIQDPNYCRHVSLGYNYRMSELCAAVALGQLERAEELVKIRTQTAAYYLEAIADSPLLRPQFCPAYSTNSYWSFSAVLNSETPSTDWHQFRKLFLSLGGDPFYAAWKLSYFEPLFLNDVQHMPGIWQKYDPGLCSVAEYLQPRMIQFKTNYWDLDSAKKQAEILHRTLHQF